MKQYSTNVCGFLWFNALMIDGGKWSKFCCVCEEKQLTEVSESCLKLSRCLIWDDLTDNLFTIHGYAVWDYDPEWFNSHRNPPHISE